MKAGFAAGLVIALSLLAAAQGNKPAPSLHLAGSAEDGIEFAGNGVPPALCDPCLFYAGDLDPADRNANGFSNEDTVFIPGSSTYAAYFPSRTVTVTGIFFNVQADANFDPLTATYDVRTGVTEHDGGTRLASGTTRIQVAATGRIFTGINEYSIAVRLAAPLVLNPGEYWFNVTPMCTNGATDGSCSVGRIYASNTTRKTNQVAGYLQPAQEAFLDSVFFGLKWINWCDPEVGLNPRQCSRVSYGLIGEAK